MTSPTPPSAGVEGGTTAADGGSNSSGTGTGEGLTFEQAAASLGVSERTLRRTLAAGGEGWAARLVTVRRRTASGLRSAQVLPPGLLADVAAALGVPWPADRSVDSGAEDTTAAGTLAEAGTTEADRGEDGGSRVQERGQEPAQGRRTPAEAPEEGGSSTAARRQTAAPGRRIAAEHGRRAADGGAASGAVRELLREKDRRIGELTAALEHEREAHRRAEALHLATLGEAQELRRRAAELEEQNRRLIGGASIGQDAPSGAPGAPESGATASGGVVGRPEPSERQGTGKEPARAARPWWRFWQAQGRGR